MKSLMFALSLVAGFFAQAALPTAGEYLCNAERAFNTPPSTVDTLRLLYWTDKNGNPTVKLSTIQDTHTLQPSIFGGDKARILQPTNPQSCTSGLPYRQVLECAQAQLPALVDSENLFMRPDNVQSVHGVRLSGNYSGFSLPNKNHNLAIQIEYRRNHSYWLRIYSCALLK